MNYTMNYYLYSSYELALIILQHKMNIAQATEFLQNVHCYDNSFIEEQYRHHQKQFILDVMNQLNNIHQPESEKQAVQNDLNALGLLNQNADIQSLTTYHFAFKELRLRILYIHQQKYVRMKLRNFLKSLKCKRRSANMMSYIFNCLYFYHISVSLKENTACDLNTVDLDKTLIFKVI